MTKPNVVSVSTNFQRGTELNDVQFHSHQKKGKYPGFEARTDAIRLAPLKVVCLGKDENGVYIVELETSTGPYEDIATRGMRFSYGDERLFSRTSRDNCPFVGYTMPKGGHDRFVQNAHHSFIRSNGRIRLQSKFYTPKFFDLRGNQIEKSKVKEGSILQCSMVLKPYEMGNFYGFCAEFQKKIVVH